MKWSFPLARVAGIPIRIHLSFLLIVGWIAWLGWTEGGWVSSLWAVALILALFACVVIHELAHSLVAIRFGGKVRSVTLWPIGGVASMKSIPEQPRQELLISLAGPLVNVMIAGLLILARGGFPAWIDVPLVPRGPAELADALARANLILALFNLLPAFPMDGGRVMRSLLAMFLPYARATSIAAAIGQTLAVGFVLLGLALNPFLMVIGFFRFLRRRERRTRGTGERNASGCVCRRCDVDSFCKSSSCGQRGPVPGVGLPSPPGRFSRGIRGAGGRNSDPKGLAERLA